METDYRRHLIDAIKNLMEAEQMLFTSALNVAWTGELSHLADSYENGDIIEFDLPLLNSVDDLNVKKIVALLRPLTEVAEYLKNLNKITDEELIDDENTQ